MITIKCDCCGKKIRRNGKLDSYWGISFVVERYDGDDNLDETGLELAPDEDGEFDICNACYKEAVARQANNTRPKNVRKIVDAAVELGFFKMVEPEKTEGE